MGIVYRYPLLRSDKHEATTKLQQELFDLLH